MMAEPTKIIKIYYCYAPADRVLRDDLEKHLSPLRRLRQVTWSYCDILAGTNWEQEIEGRINRAHLILLLISPDFIASDQCYTVEMQQALERQQVGEALVIPILLRPVDWEEAPFSHLPVLPRNAKPVTQWSDRDVALLDVAWGVREAVKRLIAKQELSESETKILEQVGRPPKFLIGQEDLSTQQIEDLDDTIEDAWHSRMNWHKDVATKPGVLDSPTGGETPPGLLIPPSLPARRRMPSGVLFWVSMLLLFVLVMGGLFGVVVALGRGVKTPPPPLRAGPYLQITPSSVALGALISLQGTNFTPNGRIGLSYDNDIPIIDTAGNSVILADKKGNFTDTAIVEPEWQAGPHTIHAEDAMLHKIASFTVPVTGQSPSFRPAHLRLSAIAVDLGSGDQATNSTQSVRQMNMGGGLVTWQTTVTQPWLMVSPKNGSFANNQSVQVTIAANRSNLTPGSYTASVIFTSNAGQISLPVKMEVTSLQPEHEPILQLTPAVLAFSDTDGGTNPSGQVATISNPGTQPLPWNATSGISDGPDWLSISPRSGNVAPGASQAVTIGTTINALLPGVYSGEVTFTSQGSEAVKGSPQSIYVSLTVLPQCLLQVSPGLLSFAGVHSQPVPAPKSVDLSVTQGCSAPLHWSATTKTDDGGQWLNIDGASSANGTTPTNPSVSVNATALAAGTYMGAVVFTTTVGTQTLPVTLTIGQSATPIMITTPPAMAFNAVVGQFSPATQTITISNTGGGTLMWNATAATDVGGAWLAVTPAQGTLLPQQSATLTVSATLLSSLTPDIYNGTITIGGLDDAGNPAPGSPQQLPVTFRVQAACAIAVAPTALSFTGVTGQSDAETQPVTIGTNGACEQRLDWTATVSTSDGGSWLTATPTTGAPRYPTPPITRISSRCSPGGPTALAPMSSAYCMDYRLHDLFLHPTSWQSKETALGECGRQRRDRMRSRIRPSLL